MSRHGESNHAAGGGLGPGRRRQPQPSRRRTLAWRAAAWLSVVIVVLLVTASIGAYVKYRSVWGSIRRIEVTGLGHEPPRYNNALNILLIGSDTRAGQNRQFGAGIAGQRSDTIMLLHISPGHQHATVISIPRDTMVPVLRCPPEGGGAPGQPAQRGQFERINQAYADGGPGCLWQTVEHQTRVRIDHFISLNFTGFEQVINDLGGVDICLPVAINDPDSKLHLPAGLHHVMGGQALAFWRERHIGTGSDLQRIQRDQYLMAAIVRDVTRSDLLGHPTRLYAVIRDIAGAMTTDAGLDQETMLTIAESLRRLSSGSVQFITVPEVPYPPDPQAEIQFAQPQAKALFSAVARNHALPRRPELSSKDAGRAASHPGSAVSNPAPAARSARRAPGPPPAPHRPPASPSPPVGGLAQTYRGITGGARSCGDQAAFAGGDQPSDFPPPGP